MIDKYYGEIHTNKLFFLLQSGSGVFINVYENLASGQENLTLSKLQTEYIYKWDQVDIYISGIKLTKFKEKRNVKYFQISITDHN